MQSIAFNHAELINNLLTGEANVTKTLAHTPVIVNALLASNKSLSSLPEDIRAEKISTLNKQWLSLKDKKNAFIHQYLHNTVANILHSHQLNFPKTYGEIFITNKYGVLLGSTGHLTTLAHAHKYWWIAAYNKGNGRIFFDDRGYDKSVGNYVIGVVVPISYQGQFIGLIKSNVLLEKSLNNIVSTQNTQSRTQMKLVRTGGLIVIDEINEPLTRNIPAHFKHPIIEQKSGKVYYPDNGDLIAFSPVILTLGNEKYGFGGKYESIGHLLGNEGESWMVIIFENITSALGNFYNYQQKVFLGGFILLLFIALTAIFLTKLLTKPLITLVDAMNRVGKGDLDVFIDVNTQDELGYVSNVFNQMNTRLKTSTTSIENLSKEILKRKEKELELKSMNQLLSGITTIENGFIADVERQTLFEDVLKLILDITESEYGFIGEVLHDKEGAPYLKTFALTNIAWNDETRKFYDLNAPQGMEFHNLKSLFGEVMITEKVVISNDPKKDSRSGGLPPGHPPLNAFLGLPVHAGDKLVGMMGVSNRLNGYEQNTVEFLKPLINSFGAIITAIRFKEANRQNEIALLHAHKEELQNRLKAKDLELKAKLANDANALKSEFLANMSHELRTPMNAILGFSQLLEMDKKDPLTESQKNNVLEICNAGKHLLNLINDILDLSKIESNKIELSMEYVALSDIFSESLQLILPLAKKRGITLQLLMDGTTVSIEELTQQDILFHSDYTRLKQVFLNLLSNAIKYNNDNGSIIVSCDYSENNKLHISFTDTGIGISDVQKKQLFKPFTRLQTNNKGIEGTGIGLVITKKIIELMGGKIDCESTPGKGSTFWIELPCEFKNTTPSHIVSHIVSTDEKKLINNEHNYSILYIEDNPANLRLVQQVLNVSFNVNILSAHEPF